MDISETSDHIKIKIKIQNPSQESPASSKAPNEDLKDMDVLCTFKIKIEPKFGSWVYQIPMIISKQDQDAKPQSGTSSILLGSNQDLMDIDVLCPFKVSSDS